MPQEAYDKHRGLMPMPLEKIGGVHTGRHIIVDDGARQTGARLTGWLRQPIQWRGFQWRGLWKRYSWQREQRYDSETVGDDTEHGLVVDSWR